MDKKCVACAMPMTKPEDFALGDTTKNYCRYCARPDGSMKSYDEVRTSMIEFTVRSQGVEESVAERTVDYSMSKINEWKKYYE